MGTLFYFIFSIFAPCDTDIEPYYLFRGAVTETVICRSLLPKANGGGGRGVHVHNKRAMQSILCSVHGDTMTR